MLNNKGVYYAKLIVNDIDDLKDVLINANILKPSDFGANSNLADISKKIRTSLKAKMKEGKYIGSRPPYGYQNFTGKINYVPNDQYYMKNKYILVFLCVEMIKIV